MRLNIQLYTKRNGTVHLSLRTEDIVLYTKNQTYLTKGVRSYRYCDQRRDICNFLPSINFSGLFPPSFFLMKSVDTRPDRESESRMARKFTTTVSTH